ncbi:MAG: hypothetical protein Rubg2KO_38180 [Rubricoccaceae bacterium]
MAVAQPTRLRRYAAAALDGGVAIALALLPAALAPAPKDRAFGAGLILAAAFLLLRDGFPYKEYGARSLAKRWFGMRPVPMSGNPMSLIDSVRRNATLGGAVGFIGVLKLVGGPSGFVFDGLLIGIALGLIAVEALLVGIDPIGRRIGDRIARTRVLEARA